MFKTTGAVTLTWTVEEDCLLTGVNNCLHGGSATAKGLIFIQQPLSGETPNTFETPTADVVLEQFYLLPTFQGQLSFDLLKGWVIGVRTGTGVLGAVQLFLEQFSPSLT